MSEHFCTKIEESETGILDNRREEINKHLQALESEIQRYFPKCSEQEAALVRNQFHISFDVTDILDEVQDEFLELRNDFSAHDLFQEKSLPQFQCALRHSYHKVSMLFSNISTICFYLSLRKWILNSSADQEKS